MRDYFAASSAAWAAAAEQLPQPWDPAWAANDLRWWAARRADEGCPAPTISTLAERWGWSSRRVRRLLHAGVEERGVPDWAARDHYDQAAALLEDYRRRDPRRRGAAR